MIIARMVYNNTIQVEAFNYRQWLISSVNGNNQKIKCLHVSMNLHSSLYGFNEYKHEDQAVSTLVWIKVSYKSRYLE